MKKSELFFSAILVPIDFLMLLSAGIAAYFLRTSSYVAEYRPVLFSLNLPFQKYFVLLSAVVLVLLIVFALVGLYRIKPIRLFSDDFPKILVGVSAGLIILVFYIFIRKEFFNSRFIILTGWVLAIIFTAIGRFLISRWQRYLMKKYHYGASRVLIIGNNGIAHKIIRHIQNNPSLGYFFVDNLGELDLSAIKFKLRKPGFDEVILAQSDFERDKIIELVDFCEENHLGFRFVPNLFETLTTNTSVEILGELPIVELKRTALDGWGKIIKRLIDILGAIVSLIALSPLFLILAALIRMDSRGPVFVRLKRISQNKEFFLYKFRSMVKNAEAMKKDLMRFNERSDSPLFKIKDDPRITRLGRILRKYRLDELPQFINALGGEISLVGPRPHQPDEIARYQKHHKKVLAIKAGITGLSQISGASDLPFEEEVRLDTYYIEHWSMWLDIKILLKTILVIFKKQKTY